MITATLFQSVARSPQGIDHRIICSQSAVSAVLAKVPGNISLWVMSIDLRLRGLCGHDEGENEVERLHWI